MAGTKQVRSTHSGCKKVRSTHSVHKTSVEYSYQAQMAKGAPKAPKDNAITI